METTGFLMYEKNRLEGFQTTKQNGRRLTKVKVRPTTRARVRDASGKLGGSATASVWKSLGLLGAFSCLPVQRERLSMQVRP